MTKSIKRSKQNSKFNRSSKNSKRRKTSKSKSIRSNKKRKKKSKTKKVMKGGNNELILDKNFYEDIQNVNQTSFGDNNNFDTLIVTADFNTDFQEISFRNTWNLKKILWRTLFKNIKTVKFEKSNNFINYLKEKKPEYYQRPTEWNTFTNTTWDTFTKTFREEIYEYLHPEGYFTFDSENVEYLIYKKNTPGSFIDDDDDDVYEIETPKGNIDF